MSRRTNLFSGCFIAVIALFCVATVAVVIALRIAGVRTVGRTDAYVTENATVNAAATTLWPTPTLAAPLSNDGAGASTGAAQPLDEVQIELGSLPQPQTFSADQLQAERLERGQTPDGQTAYYIEYDEAGFNDYMQTWLAATNAETGRLQNIWFDLKPGGVMVYADVNLLFGTQRVGALFTVAENGHQFAFQGVDIAGQLLSTPPTGEMADTIAQLENSVNASLRDLTFIDAAGPLSIQQITITEDGAQILAY